MGQAAVQDPHQAVAQSPEGGVVGVTRRSVVVVEGPAPLRG